MPPFKPSEFDALAARYRALQGVRESISAARATLEGFERQYALLSRTLYQQMHELSEAVDEVADLTQKPSWTPPPAPAPEPQGGRAITLRPEEEAYAESPQAETNPGDIDHDNDIPF